MEVVELIRWAAAISTIVAAILVAIGRPARLVAWGFVLFCIASLCWLAAAGIEGLPAILAQNGVLLVVNVVGLVRWWRREE